jgi:hypothetical protein
MQYQRIVFIPQNASWALYLQTFFMVSDLDTSKEAFMRNDSLFRLESDTSNPKFAFMVPLELKILQWLSPTLVEGNHFS